MVSPTCLMSLANSHDTDAPPHPFPWRHHSCLTCAQSRLPPHVWRWCCEGTVLTLCLLLSGFPARPFPSGYASSICGNLLAERKRAESPWIWIWTLRECWEGTGGSYLAPCCPSPRNGIVQATWVFSLSFAVLAVVQAKEAERRRQHREARRGFLAGPFAAFLATQRCCSQRPDPSWSNQRPQTPLSKLKDELWTAAEEQGVAQGGLWTPGSAAAIAAGIQLAPHSSVSLSWGVCRIWDTGDKTSASNYQLPIKYFLLNSYCKDYK